MRRHFGSAFDVYCPAFEQAHARRESSSSHTCRTKRKREKGGDDSIHGSAEARRCSAIPNGEREGYLALLLHSSERKRAPRRTGDVQSL